MSKIQRRIEMTGDRLLRNMLLFAFPILVSNLFQRLFNAADTIIVGRFCGTDALAAVGGTGPVVGLFTWGLMGFSIGADVVVARMIGQKDTAGAQRALHTAYFLAITTGLLMACVGIGFAQTILSGMGIPAEILNWSVLYLRIYFIGLFFNVVFNFGAACLRSVGDSRRPTTYLIFAGLLNVVLNILCVSLLGMGVAGVAIATVLSQLLAAALVTITLLRGAGELRLIPTKIRPEKTIAKQMFTIGLPACLQNATFSLSNIVIQSSINSFGSMAIAANSAATSIEDFVYISTGAVNQTCTTFTGQNSGAGKKENIHKVLRLCLAMTVCMGFSVALIENIFARPLLGLFVTDEQIISIGMLRLQYVVLPLFLNGVMDVFACSMRGMGSSVIPMITSLIGICGCRLLYVFTVFRYVHTLPSLYLCYPISWAITSAVLFFLWRRHMARHPFPQTES